MKLATEVSCALCGNQAVPEESDESQAGDAEPSPFIRMPSVLELEVPDDGREHAPEDFDFAIEYFLGFMDSYPKLPDISNTGGTTRVSFIPSPSQSAALHELCTKLRVGPEELASLAVQFYGQRET